MSIDNMLTALEQSETPEEFISIFQQHFAANDFLVRGVEDFEGVRCGLFALDLRTVSAVSLDAVYMHGKGYKKFRDLRELREFLDCMVFSKEFEEAS